MIERVPACARALFVYGPGETNLGDRTFKAVVTLAALTMPVLLVAVVALLFVDALPSIARSGPAFLTSSTWDPAAERFGGAAFLYSTLVTSAIALLIGAPIAVGCAIFAAEIAPRWLADPIALLLDLLAAIPSIIFGLWGVLVLTPIMGRNLLAAGIILSIMVVPTIASIARAILRAVPNAQREGMLALGATRWETVQRVVLPYARDGLLGACVLGLARALTETMAVLLVIGNASTQGTVSLLTPGNTLASAIANLYTAADTPLQFSAIVEIALVLLLVAAITHVAARLLLGGVPSMTRRNV